MHDQPRSTRTSPKTIDRLPRPPLQKPNRDNTGGNHDGKAHHELDSQQGDCFVKDLGEIVHLQKLPSTFSGHQPQHRDRLAPDPDRQQGQQ